MRKSVKLKVEMSCFSLVSVKVEMSYLWVRLGRDWIVNEILVHHLGGWVIPSDGMRVFPLMR